MEQNKATIVEPKVNGFYYVSNKLLGEPVFIYVKVTEIEDDNHLKVQVMQPSESNFLDIYDLQTEYYEFWNNEPTVKEWLDG